MKKDFRKWHALKEKLDSMNSRVFFHEREVWWCSLGVNVGFEQDGRGTQYARPILVFKKFNKEVFWALPLSTKIKTGKFYVPIDLQDGVARVVIISQLRLMDGKRLLTKVVTISEDNYGHIQKAIMNLCSS